MNKSGRRVLRATAAVAGITALGAVGSGIAFADNVTGHGATDSYGETDFAGDRSGLPTDALESVDLYSFEMPSLGENSVKGRSSGHSGTATENTTSAGDTATEATGTEKKASGNNDSEKKRGSEKKDSESGNSGEEEDFGDGSTGGLLGGLLGS